MKISYKLTTVAAALMLSLGANAGVIDTFSTAQGLLTDNTANGIGLSSSVTTLGTDILGGERDIFVSLLSTGGNAFANAAIGVGAGALSFSVSAQASGTGTVQWDGIDNSIALNTTGLGGVSLIADGSAAFRVDTLFSDLGYRFDIEAYTNATTFTKISFLAHAANSLTTSFIPFSGFTNAGLCGFSDPTGTIIPGVTSISCGAGGNVNFASLGALQLIIDPLGGTTAVDLTLDSVTTVPEPGVLALMGLGLMAAGFAGRRRKSQS